MSTVQMVPPLNGEYNPISINGRIYSGSQFSPAAVPAFDAPVLQANGWTQYLQSGETFGAKLRRLATAAQVNNPVDRQRLQGSIPWTTNTAYVAGTVVSSNGRVWQAQTSATSGGTAPVGYGPTSSDQVITWTNIGPQTAPVVSVSLTHNSALSQYASVPATAGTGTNPNYFLSDNTGVIRYKGGIPFYAANFPPNLVESVTVNAAPGAGETGYGSYRFTYISYAVEFYGTQLEIQINQNSEPITIVVDGQLIDSEMNVLVNNAYPFPTYGILDFTNVQQVNGPTLGNDLSNLHHTIEFYTQGTPGLQGFNYAPTSGLYYPKTNDNFTVAIVGDSQSVGAGTSGAANYWDVKMAQRLGWPDIAIFGLPGTGFISTGAGLNSFSSRVADMALYNSFRPIELIIAQASSNDAGSTPAQITQAVINWVQLVRTYSVFVTTPIIIIGTVAGGSNGSATVANITAIENATLAGAATANGLYGNVHSWTVTTDPAGPFCYGTGNQGATNGSGPSDTYVSTDGLHLSDIGCEEYSKWNVKKFINFIDSLP